MIAVTDEPDWVAVRADYEGGQGTLTEIEARYGLNRQQLNEARRSGGWTPRRPKACRPKRATLVARLMLVLDRLVFSMEMTLAQGKNVDAAQMRLLDTMVRTLERLDAMEKATVNKAKDAGGPRKRTPAEEAALRRKLAERIATLGEG